MLFLPNVNVPAGESIWCPPLGPHSTNGSASLMLYPLVQVTVIYHVINNQALVQREKDEWTCIGSQTTITRALHWQKQVQSLNLLHSKISLVPAEGRRAPLDFQTSLCLRQQSASAITVQNKSSSNTIQTIQCQYITQKKLRRHALVLQPRGLRWRAQMRSPLSGWSAAASRTPSHSCCRHDSWSLHTGTAGPYLTKIQSLNPCQ